MCEWSEDKGSTCVGARTYSVVKINLPGGEGKVGRGERSGLYRSGEVGVGLP